MELFASYSSIWYPYHLYLVKGEMPVRTCSRRPLTGGQEYRARAPQIQERKGKGEYSYTTHARLDQGLLKAQSFALRPFLKMAPMLIFPCHAGYLSVKQEPL